MKFWESNHQSVQEGDMQFIALYKFYYQDLYAYGVSLGFNAEDVKDAIQEVYLKLYFIQTQLIACQIALTADFHKCG